MVVKSTADIHFLLKFMRALGSKRVSTYNDAARVLNHQPGIRRTGSGDPGPAHVLNGDVFNRPEWIETTDERTPPDPTVD